MLHRRVTRVTMDIGRMRICGGFSVPARQRDHLRTEARSAVRNTKGRSPARRPRGGLDVPRGMGNYNIKIERFIIIRYYIVILRDNMASTYSIPPVYEDVIAAVVKAGYYSSKSDVVRDALRHLFETKTPLKISAAVEMYKEGKVSLGKAAEMAGMDPITFKEVLRDRNVPIEIVADSKQKLDKRGKILEK